MLNMLVGVVRNKMVAIILGPGGMGLLSLFNSTIKLVSESTNIGISLSGVKMFFLFFVVVVFVVWFVFWDGCKLYFC